MQAPFLDQFLGIRIDEDAKMRSFPILFPDQIDPVSPEFRHDLGYFLLRVISRNSEVEEVNQLIFNVTEDLAEVYMRRICSPEDAHEFDHANKKRLDRFYSDWLFPNMKKQQHLIDSNILK